MYVTVLFTYHFDNTTILIHLFHQIVVNGFSDPGAPAFSSRLWAMRRAVQRGYEALDTVSELDILLQVPAIWSTQEAREEVLEEVDNAVNLLAQSLGIRGLGLTSADLAIDGALAAALLQSVKGKRLIARSFPLLPPEKKWLLVQPMLARVLQASSSSNVPSIEETQADASLCTALIAFFSQARNHATTLRQKDQDSADATRPMPESEPFWFVLASQLLAHCRVTVKSVLVGFLGPNRESLLKALQLTGDTGLGDAGKVRLDVLRALLATGDKMLGLMLSVQGTGVQDLEEKLQEWKQTKDALLSLLGASN